MLLAVGILASESEIAVLSMCCHSATERSAVSGMTL